MDAASTLIHAGVVTAVGLTLGWLGKGRIEDVERRIDRVETGLRDELGAIRVELNGLRSDLNAVALAVGARPRTQNG